VLSEHTKLLAYAREHGAPVLIVYALTRRGFGEIATGDWTTLTTGAAEAIDLARASGQPALTRLPLAWLAVLAALRERPNQLAEHLTEIDQLPKGGLTVVAADDLVPWARALAADTPVAGLHHLRQISPGPVRRLAAIDRLETAVRADRPDLAGTGPTS
jgi:hypothetical protein